MKFKKSIFLLLLTVTLQANDIGKDKHVANLRSSGSTASKKGLLGNGESPPTSTKMEMVTKNESENITPILQLSCAGQQAVPSIINQEGPNYFSPSWLDSPSAHQRGQLIPDKPKLDGFYSHQNYKPLSLTEPPETTTFNNHLKVMTSVPSKATTTTETPKLAKRFPASPASLLKQRIHTVQSDGEQLSQTYPPVSSTLQFQPLPGTPKTTSYQQPSLTRTTSAGSSEHSAWNIGSKMNGGHEGGEEKWFGDANTPTILEMKRKSIWRRDDKVWKSGKARKDPEELVTAKNEEITATPISKENKMGREIVEPGREGESGMKETTGEEQNSVAFQLLDPGIGGDSGDSEAGLNRGDSRDPAWRVHRIHPKLSYVITGDKLLIYSKGSSTAKSTKQKSAIHNDQPSVNLNDNSHLAANFQPNHLADPPESSLFVSSRPSRSPASLLASTSSSSSVRLSSAPLSLSLLPPPPAISDPAPPSTRPFSHTASTAYASSPPTLPTMTSRSSLTWSALPTTFFLKYQGSSTRSIHAGTIPEESLVSSVSLTYTIDQTSTPSQQTWRRSAIRFTKPYGTNSSDRPTTSLPKDSLSMINKITSPTSGPSTSSSFAPGIPLTSSTSSPPEGEKALAVLRCSSGTSEITVYVVEECKEGLEMQLPRKARALCLSQPIKDQRALQQPALHPKHDWQSHLVRKALLQNAEVPLTPSSTAQPSPRTLDQSRSNTSQVTSSETPQKSLETENYVNGVELEVFHQAPNGTEERQSSDDENVDGAADTSVEERKEDEEVTEVEKEGGDKDDGDVKEKVDKENADTEEEDVSPKPVTDSKSKLNQKDELARDLKAEKLRRPSRDLGLTHYQRPDSAPLLRYTPIEQTVSPGSPVSLKCSAQGSPAPVITWSRDHQPLITSTRTSVGSFRTALGEVVSHVNLSDVTVRDGGTYTCTAHNALGSSFHSARLNVYGPPFIRAMPNVTAVSGEDVRLWCPAGGFPTPTITWRRDGQAIPSTIRQEVLTNGTLLVRNAGQSDVGQYSCVVSGRQGSQAASHTYLHVLKPPEIEPFSFGRDMEEGTRTQLSCAVKKGDLPMTINWLKDGRHLQHDPDVESKQISEFSTVLLFKSLREHHSGSYTCEAANAAATVNHTTTVRVKVSPKWVVEPASGTALVGATVILDCSARGYPKPVLTWLKATGETAQDFQQVVLDGVHSSQAPNGSLVVMETTTSDAGWFLCSATNSVGKPISKVVQLIVHAPARVVSEGGRITGHAGQTIAVPCEATGDSPLTLTWQRDHTPVAPTHRVSIQETGVGSIVTATLEIREISAGDAGAYTCRADNPHGHHQQVFTISVIEPPTAPSGVTISEVTSRSALVSWTLPQPAAVTIQYRAAEEKSWATHGRNVSVGQWTSSHPLGGLAPYQAYAVRLMAHNDLGVSQPSHMHVFTTQEEAPSGAPRDVQVTSGGPRSLLVKWRAPSPQLLHGPLRGYTLAVRRQNLQGHLTFITRPALVATESSVSEQYEVLGLNPSSLYEVAVRAFTRAGAGPLSSPRIVHATGHDAPSCSPTGVSCRGSGRGGIRVWWSPPPTHCANAPVSGYAILVTPTTHLTFTSGSSKWEVNTTNLEKNLDGLPSAANISVRVKAFNDVGASPPNNPVFCVTEDDVPGPPGRVRVIVTGASRLLVTWLPPQPSTGSVLHYTLYSARDDQVAVRDVVGAGGSEATWRELTGLAPGTRVQVWVTATTVAGEGNASPRLTAVPSATPKYSPIAVGGGLLWRVGSGAGVTLGCRGLGMPSPTISWTKGSSFLVLNGQFTQLLPGGDLHLTGIRKSSNFTCWVKNNLGMDSLTHQVMVMTTPMPPTLTLSLATHDSLNLSIAPADDGGAPILGYTLHHRGRAGEWVESNAEPGSVDVVLRGLSCGAPHHLYVTAWNSHGTSSPSPVLVTNTQGKPPGRPDPDRLVEVNATCVILRLYSWPEVGCPITHWKVELGSESEKGAWHPLHAHISRAATDLALCDLSATSWHLLRITASSTSGDTVVVYKVATGDYNGGSISAESVQEVVVGGAMGVDGWLDAHVVAGVVSAILLATALIICICVIVRRRKYGGYRQGESLDNKDGGEDDNARNCEITRSHLYSPTPTKKPRGSLASVKTQDDTSDPYEICPYATFSSEGTLEYGLSLHAMTPRDCLDHPVHSDRHVLEAPAYGHTSRQRAQSHYKETEIAYISNRGRAEYASRPKSISGTQPTPAPTPTPITATAEQQRAWAEDSRKDTRGRPHRSRSRTRTESTQRDSSTESNDASSPVQQRQHYQHPQITQQHHHIPPQQQQQQPQQQQQQPQQHPPPHPQQVAAGRGRPHPLPPVRLAR